MPPTKKKVIATKPKATKIGTTRATTQRKRAVHEPSSSRSTKVATLKSKAGKKNATVAAIHFKMERDITQFKTVEDANAFFEKLPKKTKNNSEVVFFSSQEEYNEYAEVVANTNESEDEEVTDLGQNEVAVVTPQKQPKNNPYKTSPPIKQEYLVSSLDVSPIKGSLRHRLKQKAATSGSRFKIHWFVGVPTFAKHNVILYEFQDAKSDFNHWCHKPNDWQDLFSEDKLAPKNQQEFHPWLHGNIACTLRNPNALAGDQAKTITRVNKGSNVTYELTAYGLYGLLPMSHNQDTTIDLLRKAWQGIVFNDEPQRCYHDMMMVNSKSEYVQKETQPSSVNAKAHYWNQLKGALDHIVFEMHNSLDEVFMKKDINDILIHMFDLNHKEVLNEDFDQDPVKANSIRQFALRH